MEGIVMRKSWILSAVLSAAVAGVAPSAFAADRSRDSEAQIKYDRVPREIRETLDRERRNHDIKRIDWVRRDDRVFYRAIIDEKGDDLVIRISEGGRVLSREDVRDEPIGREARGAAAGDRRSNYDFGGTETQIKYAAAPDRIKDALDRERSGRDLRGIYEVRTPAGRTFYRGVIDERGTDRVVRISDDGRVLGDSDFAARDDRRDDVREARPAAARYQRTDYGEPAEVNFDRLPGPVRMGIAGQAKANRINRVTEYRGKDGHSVYRAEVGNGDRSWYIRVDESGRFLGQSNATEEGKIRVDFNDLPGPIKVAVVKEVPDRQRGDIIQITREGRTYYRVEHDEGPTSRWVTIDDRGRVTGEIDRPDPDRRDRR